MVNSLRYITAGESHGKALMAIIEGLPANLALNFDRINNELKRRQQGFGRGARQSIESDCAQFIAGVRGGLTLGSPIGILIENRDYQNWAQVMDAQNGDPSQRQLTAVRPGHCDLAGCIKYNQKDARNILERASARETAARTAAGATARELLYELGINVYSRVLSIGGQQNGEEISLEQAIQNHQNGKAGELSEQLKNIIKNAAQKGDTLGGEVMLFARGVRAGLGSHIQFDKRLDFAISGHLAAIQAVKSVSIGSGDKAGSFLGSNFHDKIQYKNNRFLRPTNNAGGIEGGISNGEDIIVKLAIKPIPTLKNGLETVDLATKQSIIAANERSDVCAVEAAAVVGENVLAFVLASAVLDKTGGDHIDEVRQSWQRL